MLKDVREDIQDKVSKEEFMMVVSQQDGMKRDVSRFATLDEMAERLDALNILITQKLNERPTLGHLRRTLETYDDKLDVVRDSIRENRL